MSPDYRLRQCQLVEILRKRSLDCLLLFSNRSESRYSVWASGCACRSSGHYLLVEADGVRFIDVSYRAPELRQLSAMNVLEVAEETLFAEFFRARLPQGGRVGIAGLAPVTHFLECGCQLLDLGEEVDRLLVHKSDQEVAQLSALACSAAEAVDECWGRMTERADTTEAALACELRSALMSLADQFAFPLSVVSGENLRVSTLGSPTEKIPGAEDACVIDFGVTRNGLTVDLTRTYFRAENELSRAYHALSETLFNSIPLLKPGVRIGDWISALRALLAEAGLPETTLEVQDLGHGVGFGLHEPPFIELEGWNEAIIETGMVLCIEPEITVSGFRLRREEMVAIESSGGRLISGESSSKGATTGQ